MARTDTLTNYLTDIATAIKTKKGDETPILASNFDTEITDLPSGVSEDDYFNKTISQNMNAGTNLDNVYFKKLPDITLVSPTTGTYLFYMWSVSIVPKILNTELMTNMNYFAYYCKALELDFSYFDTSNVTSMRYALSYCNDITRINVNGWDTSNVTDMYRMFYQTLKITDLDLSSFDASNVINIEDMFGSGNTTAVKLENLTFMNNLGAGYLTTASANSTAYALDLSKHENLTHDSLMDVINKLYDIATKGVQTQQLKIGSVNLAKLTETEINIANAKGWSVT